MINSNGPSKHGNLQLNNKEGKIPLKIDPIYYDPVNTS